MRDKTSLFQGLFNILAFCLCTIATILLITRDNIAYVFLALLAVGNLTCAVINIAEYIKSR